MEQVKQQLTMLIANWCETQPFVQQNDTADTKDCVLEFFANNGIDSSSFNVKVVEGDLFLEENIPNRYDMVLIPELGIQFEVNLVHGLGWDFYFGEVSKYDPKLAQLNKSGVTVQTPVGVLKAVEKVHDPHYPGILLYLNERPVGYFEVNIDEDLQTGTPQFTLWKTKDDNEDASVIPIEA
jgi:hypothetical protein